MTVVPTNSVAHLTTLSSSKCCKYKVREPLTETYVANFMFLLFGDNDNHGGEDRDNGDDVENADAAADDDDDDNDTAKCRTELKVSTCQAR